MPNTGTVVTPEGLEKQRHCCYLSHFLPQHLAPFTAQSFQAESVVNFSHRAIDHHCRLPKKAHSRHLQASPVPPHVSNVQSFFEEYMSNFQQLVALGNQNFSATKHIPCDSTTFPLSADVLKKSMLYTVRKLCSVKWT